MLNSDLWSESICNSTYFEKVLYDLIPTMTSDTVPSGKVIYNSQHSTRKAYYVFDKNEDTKYATDYNEPISNYYVGYEFPNDVTLYKMKLIGSNGSLGYYLTKLQCLQNNQWIDITDSSTTSNWNNYEKITQKAKTNKIRIVCTGSDRPSMSESGVTNFNLYDLRVYGRS